MADTPFLSPEEWAQIQAENAAIQASPDATLPPSLGDLSAAGYDTKPLAGATDTKQPMTSQTDYWLRGGPGEGNVDVQDIPIPLDILMQQSGKTQRQMEDELIARSEAMPWDTAWLTNQIILAYPFYI